MQTKLCSLLLVTLCVVSTVKAQERLDTPRPIAARHSTSLEELTWMEVRDRLLANDTTVIVASGGVEANGPYTVLGKHNLLTEQAVRQIAERLGNTLVAPVIRFVPEGDISPPTLHMRYPGTLTVREETYRAVVRESCLSLAQHGFNNIVLLGDSYGNQLGMRDVAAELNREWKGTSRKAYFISEYYDPEGLKQWFARRGVTERSEGIHDDITYTTMLLAIDPTYVRFAQRKDAHRLSINGISLLPLERMQQLGMEAIDHRVQVTVEAIRSRLRADGRVIDMPLAPDALRRYRSEQ